MSSSSSTSSTSSQGSFSYPALPPLPHPSTLLKLHFPFENSTTAEKSAAVAQPQIVVKQEPEEAEPAPSPEKRPRIEMLGKSPSPLERLAAVIQAVQRRDLDAAQTHWTAAPLSHSESEFFYNQLLVLVQENRTEELSLFFECFKRKGAFAGLAWNPARINLLLWSLEFCAWDAFRFLFEKGQWLPLFLEDEYLVRPLNSIFQGTIEKDLNRVIELCFPEEPAAESHLLPAYLERQLRDIYLPQARAAGALNVVAALERVLQTPARYFLQNDPLKRAYQLKCALQAKDLCEAARLIRSSLNDAERDYLRTHFCSFIEQDSEETIAFLLERAGLCLDIFVRAQKPGRPKVHTRSSLMYYAYTQKKLRAFRALFNWLPLSREKTFPAPFLLDPFLLEAIDKEDLEVLRICFYEKKKAPHFVQKKIEQEYLQKAHATGKLAVVAFFQELLATPSLYFSAPFQGLQAIFPVEIEETCLSYLFSPEELSLHCTTETGGFSRQSIKRALVPVRERMRELPFFRSLLASEPFRLLQIQNTQQIERAVSMTKSLLPASTEEDFDRLNRAQIVGTQADGSPRFRNSPLVYVVNDLLLQEANLQEDLISTLLAQVDKECLDYLRNTLLPFLVQKERFQALKLLIKCLGERLFENNDLHARAIVNLAIMNNSLDLLQVLFQRERPILPLSLFFSLYESLKLATSEGKAESTSFFKKLPLPPVASFSYADVVRENALLPEDLRQRKASSMRGYLQSLPAFRKIVRSPLLNEIEPDPAKRPFKAIEIGAAMLSKDGQSFPPPRLLEDLAMIDKALSTSNGKFLYPAALCLANYLLSREENLERVPLLLEQLPFKNKLDPSRHYIQYRLLPFLIVENRPRSIRLLLEKKGEELLFITRSHTRNEVKTQLLGPNFTGKTIRALRIAAEKGRLEVFQAFFQKERLVPKSYRPRIRKCLKIAERHNHPALCDFLRTVSSEHRQYFWDN